MHKSLIHRLSVSKRERLQLCNYSASSLFTACIQRCDMIQPHLMHAYYSETTAPLGREKHVCDTETAVTHANL